VDDGPRVDLPRRGCADAVLAEIAARNRRATGRRAERQRKIVQYVDLSLNEAGELAAAMKILSNPDGPHSTQDLINAGFPT
jgi:hypothetical protein